ncbi:response regulator transcription factor [Luteimicrobium xylanilyticum]|uniref:Chemotaxis response regulator protein-glutamate methylesterase n=1 Tax=Luteimicrobium xylanilyticum TaxID=1133546 RepID=A0A5P9QA50_9MICO|nr:response regulator transcription factor [Luteimicrobium xylanilyticum]QFU97942.1 Chemotaxis response regulator protein-glutamate methylesterase [Luteimicrobium xylanilyticum]
MTTVVVADDQPVVLAAFAAIIDAANGLDVVGTAPDGASLLELVGRTKPDVAVVDVRMPVLDGIGATQLLAERHPSMRVLILTTFDLDEYVYDALRAGASGFLLKDVGPERLVEGVRLVAEGSMLLGPGVTTRLVHDFVAREPERAALPGLDDLTPREHDVLLAVAEGLSNPEIARKLFIGDQTVKSHVSEILRKTGQRDRMQLVIAAYRSGLVS